MDFHLSGSYQGSNWNEACQSWNSGWIDKTAYTGSCYRIIELQAGIWRNGWQQAKHLCTDDGADYLVIDNEVEYRLVRQMAVEANANQPLYMGLSRGSYWLPLITSEGETLDEIGFNRWGPDADSVQYVWQYNWCVAATLRPPTYTYGLCACEPLTTYWYTVRSYGWAFCEKRIKKLAKK